MTFEYRDDHQLTLRINRLEPDYPGQTVTPAIWIETSDGFFSRTAVKVPAARVEEVVAGIRDAARTAARQTTGQDDTGEGPDPCSACPTFPCHECSAPADGRPDPAVVEQFIQHMATQSDPTTADDPTPLRWGLGDVEHGDDDTVTVYLSGPDREPYWLELEPEQRDALRDDLTPPAEAQTALDRVRAVADEWAQTAQRYPDSRLSTETVVFVLRTALAAPAVGQPAEAHDTDRAAELRERLRLAIAQQYLNDTGSGRTVDELDDTEFGTLADAALSVLTVEDETR